MPTRKCALYARVSTFKQAMVEEGSLDTQLDLMRKRIEMENQADLENRWEVVDEYREEGASAKNLDRPEFKRLLADIEQGKVELVLVVKLDRITRSIRDFYDLMEVFRKYGVEFVSLREKFDTTTAMGEFTMNLHLSIAQLERKQTAERTSATMNYRASRGLSNGGHILGYKSDTKRKGHLEIVPEQAKTVREHFYKKCVELGSACAVHRYLMKMGIKRPEYTSRRGKKHGGTPYNVPAVIRILTNKKYIGLIEYNGEVFQGQHDSIIDEQLFNEVQGILARNREIPNPKRDKRTHTFLLQGLLRCGRCGSMMTPRWGTGRGKELYFYYECVKRSKSQKLECDTRYLPAPAIESFAIEQLKQAVINEEEIKYIIEKANRLRNTTLNDIEIDIANTKKSLQGIENKIRNIVQIVEDGGDFSSLKTQLVKLETNQKELKNDLTTLEFKKTKTEASILSAEIVTREYASVPKIVDELFLSRGWERLKRLLQQYIEVIEWTEDENDSKTGTMKIMLFEHAQPYLDHKNKMLSDPRESGSLSNNSWRPQRDLNPRRRRERPVSLPLDDGVA